MGLTQKLGTIPLAIFTDSSNNVGIGGAANASYKFQVTGNANFTSTVNGFNWIGTSNSTFALYYNNSSSFVGGLGTYSWQTGNSNYSDLALVTLNNFAIFTGNSNTPSIYVNSSKNVGIGTSSPTLGILHLLSSSTVTQIRLGGTTSPGFIYANETNNSFEISSARDGTAGTFPNTGIASSIISLNSLSGNSFITFNTSATNNTAPSERMRITSDGNVGINMTSAPSKLSVNGNLQINGTITNLGTGTETYTQSTWYVDTGNQILFENGRTTNSAAGTGRTVYFTWRGGPSVGGGVQLIHGTNAWAPYTSDARLKTIIANVDNGIDTILKLNPIKYKWTKELEKSNIVVGFTAQNIGEAIPEAMFKSWKDEELGDVLSYFQEYITPYLVKAIQEQQAQIEELKKLINR